MAYWRLHYHLVWATYQRAPLLTVQLENEIYESVLGKAGELGIIVHPIGGVEDHVHVVASIPPRIAVADFIRLFKGTSSHHVNHQPGATGGFGWQDGYGALTFGEAAMPDVVAFFRNQKEHHLRRTTRPAFERMSDEDERVWITVT